MNRNVEVIRPGAEDELHHVQHRPNYKRDPHSKAIFVVDEKALLEHQQKKKETMRLNNVDDKILNLESELKDIKSMLESLINNSRK
jgi:hypothetical protein